MGYAKYTWLITTAAPFNLTTMCRHAEKRTEKNYPKYLPAIHELFCNFEMSILGEKHKNTRK